MASAWRNVKIIFSRPLFIIIFRPNISFFVTYSILTGETKVEFVIYWVLNPYATKNVASVIYRMKPLQNAAFWTVASEKTTLCGNNSVYVLVLWLTTTIE